MGDVPGLAQLGERHVARREARADLPVHVERVESETERGAPVVGEELGVGVDVTWYVFVFFSKRRINLINKNIVWRQGVHLICSRRGQYTSLIIFTEKELRFQHTQGRG